MGAAARRARSGAGVSSCAETTSARPLATRAHAGVAVK